MEAVGRGIAAVVERDRARRRRAAAPSRSVDCRGSSPRALEIGEQVHSMPDRITGCRRPSATILIRRSLGDRARELRSCRGDGSAVAACQKMFADFARRRHRRSAVSPPSPPGSPRTPESPACCSPRHRPSACPVLLFASRALAGPRRARLRRSPGSTRTLPAHEPATASPLRSPPFARVLRATTSPTFSELMRRGARRPTRSVATAMFVPPIRDMTERSVRSPTSTSAPAPGSTC